MACPRLIIEYFKPVIRSIITHHGDVHIQPGEDSFLLASPNGWFNSPLLSPSRTNYSWRTCPSAHKPGYRNHPVAFPAHWLRSCVTKVPSLAFRFPTGQHRSKIYDKLNTQVHLGKQLIDLVSGFFFCLPPYSIRFVIPCALLCIRKALLELCRCSVLAVVQRSSSRSAPLKEYNQ